MYLRSAIGENEYFYRLYAAQKLNFKEMRQIINRVVSPMQCKCERMQYLFVFISAHLLWR